ncbi:MAG: hypothetical protein IPK25_19205 [Saprospiraceae bacterium]|nr:hypothetical protein [Saprospiraceae bacterium]
MKKYNELYSNEIDSEVFNRSNLYGKEVAAAVWNWAKTDVVSTDAYLDIFRDTTGPQDIISPVTGDLLLQGYKMVCFLTGVKPEPLSSVKT